MPHSAPGDHDRVQPVVAHNALTAQDTHGELSLGDILATFWRRKLVIFLFSLIAGLTSIFYTVYVVEATYAARVRLVIKAETQNIVDVEAVLSGASTEEASINTEVQILQSRSLIETLVKDLDLVADSEFNTALRTPRRLSPEGIRAFLTELVFGAQANLQPEEEASRQLIDTVNQVTRALSVSARRKTYIFEITVTTSDPEKSQRIVNRLAELYLENQIAVKYAATEHAINWLSGRVSELEDELLTKTDAIDKLRQSTTLVSAEALESQNITAKDLRQRLAQSEDLKIEQQAQLDALQQAVNSKDDQAIAIQAQDPVLNRLLTGLLGNETDARIAFDRRVDLLLQSSVQALQRSDTQSTALKAALIRLEDQINVQTADQTVLLQLEREAEATRVLYETFLTRLKETSVQIGLQQADSRVLSQAIPGYKVGPRRTRALAMALVLGALLGAAYVAIRQIYYTGVRTSEELERITGRVVLGSIPRMKLRNRAALVPYLRENPTSPAVEAVRNLRTSLLMSSVDASPQIISSTSSLPGEGKTTQSVALAFSLADMGRRVLLMDGDVRRGTLSIQSGAENADGNLISLLAGETTLENSIISNFVPNVDLMRSGTFNSSAANLFSSQTFAELLKVLRQQYDHVVIDTPPVLLVPDARVIGQQSDALIYSVQWNGTKRDQFLEGLRMLERSHAPISGLVLARVDGGQMRYYGYGDQYHNYTSSSSGGYFNLKTHQ
jgi:capsular exopolysaccharide synthesis family protein